jgi:hypothetical protein
VTSESDRKRKLVEGVNTLSGGRAQRREDRYAPGVLDLIIKLPGFPLFFAEGKMIKGNLFAPTERQYEEGKKWIEVGVPALLIGWKQKFMFVSPWVRQADVRSCFFGSGQWVTVLQEYLNESR